MGWNVVVIIEIQPNNTNNLRSAKKNRPSRLHLKII